MANRMITDTLDKVKEFESMGFAKSSRGLKHYLRNNVDYSKIKFFKPGVSADGNIGSSKYTSKDIFGKPFTGRVSYIYDIRQRQKFVDFLVKMFLMENPDPDPNIRRAFTRIMHINGLHWDGCICKDKE